MGGLTRRDFIKLGSMLTGAFALSRLAPHIPVAAPSPSVIILVFDAMSAENLSLYGYRRKTTPNLERFAERATVYNQHYSAGSFTTPGTASLLTGLYPWTHRAINESGLIARRMTGNNLFRALGTEYYRLAYSQNMWPNYFFGQFQGDIEKVLSPAAFSLVDQIIGDKLPGDLAASHRAFDDFMFQDGTPPAALIFGLAERIMLRRAFARAPAQDYPRGLPRTGNYPIFFTLKDVFDGMMATLDGLRAPSLAYLHTWSPHAPYRPSRDFEDDFADGWKPKPKPDHLLGDHSLPNHMNGRRQNYDQYVADLDAQFGRLIDFLAAKGILDRSIVVVTSDHGEMFERGVEGHITPLLYDPVVRVPLLISSPGQKSRQDVNVPTNSIDVLPTLVHLSGGEVPAWCEGQILPALGGSEDLQRSIYMMDAKRNTAFSALSFASFALRKGAYKLIYYKGFEDYGNKDKFELYDIQNDPEELNDLYSETSPTASELRAELLAKVQAENAPYAG
jgi:arylsulfatase A-like enzyme